LTIDLSLLIMIALIVMVQGLERVMLVLYPLANLLFIIFAVAIFIVGLYFNAHSYYTSALPVWATTYTLYLIAIFVLILGLWGYYSVTHGRFASLLSYIAVLALSGFLSLVTGLAMILKTSSVKEAVDKEWPVIQDRLKLAGYEGVSESTFSQFLEVNLKFAGLFIIVFCLFLVMGLIPAIYLSTMMKRLVRNQSGYSDLSQTNMNL
jgi:DMSO reductase anchor subunit